MVQQATLIRYTWDEVWMTMAHTIGQRSHCSRSQCGCVVVTPKNAVVAVGYNGPPAGWYYEQDERCDVWCPRARTGGAAAYYDDCVASHAEMNALIRGSRARFEGGTLYVTRMPCFTCAKSIANSGIARVVYRHNAEDADREPERSKEMLETSGLEVITYG